MCHEPDGVELGTWIDRVQGLGFSGLQSKGLNTQPNGKEIYKFKGTCKGSFKGHL